jgi:hypothetical protein
MPGTMLIVILVLAPLGVLPRCSAAETGIIIRPEEWGWPS